LTLRAPLADARPSDVAKVIDCLEAMVPIAGFAKQK